MHRVASLIAVALSVALCIRPLDAQARPPEPSGPATVDRVPLGFNAPTVPLAGQEIQRVMCPARSYAVGFQSVLGFWLYELRLQCASITRDGTWTSVFRGPQALEMIGGLGGHSLTDFLVSTHTCPGNSYIRGLQGSMIRVKDENAEQLGVIRMPGMFTPVCGKHGVPGDFFPNSNIRDWARPTYNRMPWASFEDPEYITYGGESSPSSCQGDEVAIGAWSVRDGWIRAVGLICSSFERVRPRSAVELGAAEINPRPGLPGVDEVAPHPGSTTLQNIMGTLATTTKERVIPASALAEVFRSAPPATVGPPPSSPTGPQDRPGIGDRSVGTYNRAICDANSAMVASWVVVDKDPLEEIIVWCAEVDSRGGWMNQPKKPNHSVVMLQKGYKIDDNSVFDRLQKMTCANGSYVTGLNFGAARIDNRLAPWHAFIECRNPANGSVQELSYLIQSSRLNADHYMVGFDGVGGARSCSASEVAVGVWGTTSQDNVESLGIICQPLEEVRHRSAVESGANQISKPVTPASKDSTAICRKNPAACAGRKH